MSSITQLKFNDPAPDMDVVTSLGEPIRLSSLWQEKPLVLAFVRHFGCPQCKELLDHLVENKARLDAAGLGLAVVTQAQPSDAWAYLAKRAPGIPGLADPQRQVYRAFGLGRGTLAQTFLSPRVWKANRRAEQVKGYRSDLPPAGQDAMLMSGVFIIGRDGRIRLPYYYDDIADHPTVDLLLQGVLSTDWDLPFDGPIGGSSGPGV